MKNLLDMSEVYDFFNKIEKEAENGFKERMKQVLDELGMDFLDTVQKKIKESGSVDTGTLLKSFTKGDKNNIWVLKNGALELEIGTHLEYAQFVNDGHWTTPSGVDQRWIPGTWSGSRFNYSPGAKTGMLVKRRWIEGKHFWEDAIMVFERMFEKRLSDELERWLEEFGK